MLPQLALLVVALAQPAPMTLGDCIAEALAQHPDLAVARTGIDSARAGEKAARAGYLPNLSVQSNDSLLVTGKQESTSRYLDGVEIPIPAQPAQVDDSHGFGIFLRQPLFDGLRYWYRPQRAETALRRAELDVAVTREAVALAVIESYFNLLGQQSALQVLEQALDLSQGQLDLARERHRLGAASKVDVSQALLAVGEDRIAIEQQALVVDQARVDLNQAMGREPSAPLALAPAPAATPAVDREPERVAEQHVQLRRNLLDQRIAELDVDIAAGGLWPTVSGSIGYSRQDPEFYKVYSRFDELYQLSFTFSISYPIFEGFSTQAEIEASEAQLERTRREREQVGQQLAAALARARARLARLGTIQQVEVSNLKAAEDSLALAQESYAVGQGTALEVRDAQLAVTRARLSQVQTRYDVQISLARAHQAGGDLLQTYLPEEQP